MCLSEPDGAGWCRVLALVQLNFSAAFDRYITVTFCLSLSILALHGGPILAVLYDFLSESTLYTDSEVGWCTKLCGHCCVLCASGQYVGPSTLSFIY